MFFFAAAISPKISKIGSCKLLDQVKNFLPKLKAAESTLQDRISAGENVDIENLEDNSAHIEMNVGLNTFQNSESDYSSGTSDSDPDSPPSPAERDNSYTSDSEPSSSSTSSSSSCKVRNQMISERSVSGLSKQYTFITVSLVMSKKSHEA